MEVSSFISNFSRMALLPSSAPLANTLIDFSAVTEFRGFTKYSSPSLMKISMKALIPHLHELRSQPIPPYVGMVASQRRGGLEP